MESTREITVNITEDQTIVDLSQSLQPFKSEVYLIKTVQGSVLEVNLKSFLGLITLQLKNGDTVKIKSVGEDHIEALQKVVDFFS